MISEMRRAALALFVLVAVVAALPYGVGEAITSGVIAGGVVLVWLAAKRHYAGDEPAYESAALVRFWLWLVAAAALVFFVAELAVGIGVSQAVLGIAPVILLVALFLMLRRRKLKGTGRTG
jgi:hypothetical protein